jgi:ligand-binding sensor domain-containing protein/signal transduction histidine kinase
MAGEKRTAFVLRIASALGLVLILWHIADSERLPLKTYTTADGLVHNVVNRIVRDSRGFLWFCTEEGLSRFDGYSFTNFGMEQGLPHAGVNDLLETRGGDYWVATGGGLVRFNPKGVAGSRIVYAHDPPADAPDAPMFTVVVPEDADRYGKYINTLLEGRDGTIWCGTFRGVFRLAQVAAQLQLLPVEIGLSRDYTEQGLVTSLLEDRYGTLWVGTFSGLYRRWPDGSFARYGAKDGLNDVIPVLREDRRGRLWMGTRMAGIFRLATTADHSPPIVTRHYTHKDGLGADWIFDLYESADGKLWVGTNYGFCELSLDDEAEVTKLRAYTRGNGLSFHEIVSLTEDRDGNLWLGTNNNGAMKLARPGFITFAERDGLNSVTSLFETGAGELYAYGYVLSNERGASVFEGAKLDQLNPDTFTARRLGRFDGRRFTWFIPEVLTKKYLGWSDKPLALEARTGEWWIAWGGGLYRFPRADSPAALKAARPIDAFANKELGGAEVYSIYEDARGDLWIATIAAPGNGLFRWERATRTLRDIAHITGLPALKDRLPATFQEDRAGNVWIGFAQGELARYAADRFEVFTAADGLPAGRINALYLDREGRLWVATTRGVSRIDDPSAQHPAFVNYSATQGLSGNVTFAITEDLYGRIYIGTGQGLDQLNLATGRVKHYTTADGLAGGKISAAFRARDGWLWISTTQGLSRFLPELERQSPPPPVLLTGVQVAGTAQNVSALGETEMRLADLSASANQLQIDFVGLGFAPGESLSYQYMLEGADRDWSAPTTQRTVTYARLAPGRYRFMVRAINSDGLASAAPAALSFRILPPFWQRWWFIAVVTALTGALVYAFYRYRVRRLLELERVRTRIAADLHDDIGSSLSQISVLSEVLRTQLGAQRERVSKNISLINRVSQEALDSMSDIVWAINPQHDHLSDLVRKMRRVASETLPARDIEFTFNAPVEGHDVKLGADLRRQVFLMFKEAINNIVRHSNSTHSEIELKLSGHWLALVIADNGDGFEPDCASEGNGLVSLRRRAWALGGETLVSSRRGEGTTVTIKIPYGSRWRFGPGNSQKL